MVAKKEFSRTKRKSHKKTERNIVMQKYNKTERKKDSKHKKVDQ